MSLLYRKKLLLAKTETTYGVDSSPTGAANAILTKDLQITPIEADMLDRNLDRAALGNDLSFHNGVHVTCQFSVELAGSGTAGTAPSWACLLKACGFGETITAATDVKYAPVSSSFESVTLYYNIDGQLHKITGAMGTVSFSITPTELPTMAFSFTGLYNAPTSAAFPTADTSTFIQPLPVNDTNTTALSLGGINLISDSFSLDIANDVQYRNVIGAEKVLIVNRAPAGSVTFEAPDLTTKNWFTTALAHQTSAFNLVHGVTAGNIISFTAPAVQLTEPKYSEGQGIGNIDANLKFIPTSAGNDEILITLT